MTATGGQRVCERRAWIVLMVSAVLALLAGQTLVLSPLSIVVEPAFAAGNVPAVLGTPGLTWVLFNVFIVLVLFRNFRNGERWAWWAPRLLPVMWLFHLLFNTATVHNRVIEIIAMLGLILTCRTVFSASGGRTSRVNFTSDNPT